jgi:uncharacterized protein involved in copper resistance
MLNARLHKFIALILLLAFTSQMMATAAMNCEQEKMTSKYENVTIAKLNLNDMNMSSMDHSDSNMMHMHHHKSKTDSSQNSHQQFDCCKTMGHCLLGGCTLAAASNAITFLISTIDSSVEDLYLGISPNPLASSLYRPPISC